MQSFNQSIKKKVSLTTDIVASFGDQTSQKVKQFWQDLDFQAFFASCLEVLKSGGIGALIGLSIIPCFLIILCLFGFTCAGVAAGSYAAVRQSQIGMVPAKSCFSCCQSISMNPFTYKLIVVFGIIGFIGGVIYHFVS